MNDVVFRCNVFDTRTGLDTIGNQINALTNTDHTMTHAKWQEYVAKLLTYSTNPTHYIAPDSAECGNGSYPSVTVTVDSKAEEYDRTFAWNFNYNSNAIQFTGSSIR